MMLSLMYKSNTLQQFDSPVVPRIGEHISFHQNIVNLFKLPDNMLQVKHVIYIGTQTQFAHVGVHLVEIEK